MTAKEAAQQWGISQRRVAKLCSEQRIEGAAIHGNRWVMPRDTPKPVDRRKRAIVHTSDATPFLKWAGGKGQLLDRLRVSYPKGLGTTITKYAEPFLGGGAVLFDVLANYPMSEVYISDENPNLVNTYRCVRDHTDALLERLCGLQTAFLPLADEERKAFFYVQRDLFNQLNASASAPVARGGRRQHRRPIVAEESNMPVADLVAKAALFIFLNKTCFNGLYRVNKQGLYNVPAGTYKNPVICDEANVRKASARLANVTIACADYREAESFIDERTFVYFDPPYRPLSSTASFTSYTATDFNDQAQRELARFAERMADKGAAVLLSNSDPKNVDKHDNFFDDLYSSFTINRIRARRVINSKAGQRGQISELLISRAH